MKIFRGIAFFLWSKDRGRRWSVQLLLALSVSLGVAALVALEAFSRRIENSIARDTKTLLAADFQVQAWRTLPPALLQSVKELVGDSHALLQTDFVSTALRVKPASNKKSLSDFKPGLDENLTVQVRALEGEYPFYGNFRSEPQIKIEDLAEPDALSHKPKLLADKSLRARGFQLGDTLQLGQVQFQIAGFTVEEPNTVASAFALGPRVIVHQKWVAKTGLLATGSRAFYMLLIKSDLSESQFRKAFRARVTDPHWKLITPSRANLQAAAVIDRVRGFISFVALSALLLGGIGVFMIFRSQFLLRLPQYLSLRCLGLRTRSLIAHALFQALTVALWGWALGAGIAWIIESAIARHAAKNLNLNLAEVSYWEPLGLGLLVAVITVFVAVIIPLREVLRIPVAQAFRDSDAQTRALTAQDAIGIVAAVLALVLLVGRQWNLLVAFTLSVFVVILFQAVLAEFLIRSLERFKPTRPLVLRHALLSFTRLKGSSRLLLLSLGLGMFLLSSVLLLGFSLSWQIDFSHKIGVPNLFLLGVADTDRASLKKILPELNFVPVTQARLTEINGDPVKEVEAEGEATDMTQLYKVREYTITRRLELEKGEQLVRGDSLFGASEPNLVRASLEKSFAERIGLKVGSHFSIEVAGVALQAQVRSLRKVDWFNLKPNFFIVLNADDVADAPMDYVGITYVPKSEIPAKQREVAQLQPQITSLDGEAISQRLLSLLSQLSFAISSVSIFTLGSCIFVFAGVLAARRPQKLKEVALWRCLGLRSAPLQWIVSGEFIFTALLASIVSLGLSVAAVAGICHWVLNISMELPPLLYGVGGVFCLPIFLGILSWLFYRPLMREAPNQLFRIAEENS